MNILGIVAEYNPLHNGHIYHIKKSKEITNSDLVVVVMSGSFTQQGNIAIYDKFTRAQIAVKYGADLVLELPTIFATSSSEYFAYGAINLLNSLNIIDYISFGSESNNLNSLNKIANTLISHEQAIWEFTKIELNKGISFANARENALKNFLTEDEIKSSNLSNNILGIQYLKWLKKLNSKIKPISIERVSSDYNELSLNVSNTYTSSTSIRKMVYTNTPLNESDYIKLSKYIPIETLVSIRNKKALSNENIFELLKYKILCSSLDELKCIQEVTEGIENKLHEAISNSNSYDDFINKLKSKRYQMSKIKRMLINILLNITKVDFNNAITNNIAYAHVLACSEEGKKLFSKISTKSNIPLITSINSNVLNSLNTENENALKLLYNDILSTNIYLSLIHDKINSDYTNRL